MTRGARAACAAALVLVATIAVLSVVNDANVVRESSESGKAQLSNKELKMEREIGRDAEETTVKEEAEEGKKEAEMEAKEQAKLQSEVDHDDNMKVDMTQYGANCLALKAYARMSYDKLLDANRGAVNILRNVLEEMGAPDEEGNDNTREECTAKLDTIFTTLAASHDIAKNEDASIARSMLKTMTHQMRHKRGILIWTKLKDKSCMRGDRRDCSKNALDKNGGQWVLIDAGRVGWSGEPPIFYQLAVRARQVMEEASNMMSKEDAKHAHHITVLKDDKERYLSHEMAKKLIAWGGSEEEK